jgi:hypothetical protein
MSRKAAEAAVSPGREPRVASKGVGSRGAAAGMTRLFLVPSQFHLPQHLRADAFR